MYIILVLLCLEGVGCQVITKPPGSSVTPVFPEVNICHDVGNNILASVPGAVDYQCFQWPSKV